MSAHTPGPWEAQTNRGVSAKGNKRPARIWFSGDASWLHGHPTGGTWVAEVSPTMSSSASHQQTVADAYLIAAAPELLELAFQYISDLRHPMSEDSRQRRIERAEAVIAKAEGRA